MMSFKDKLKDYQIDLIKEGSLFGDATGNGHYKGKQYPHILIEGKEWNNLYPDIRDKVKAYFDKNKIAFWGGKTITGNTLASQVSCLNHLFQIRYDSDATKSIIQALVGDRIEIDSMIKINSKTEIYDNQYIAFEMVSDEDRLNEGKPTRGNTCTSIDAFAIALDKEKKRHVIVIEWKLVENDTGNKAPTNKTSKNEKAISSGGTRVDNYKKLIQKSRSIAKLRTDSFDDSSLFTLPFYELMRQTLWAENNKEDFMGDDYLHINVIPRDNPMRHKKYKCVNNIMGIANGWKSLLTDYGKQRYVDADPYLIVETLEKEYYNQYSGLINYLKKRYYL
ncbi:MAG: hypothetical protein IKM90_08025 [Bacteroidaceae bacterium]|nr:hypothetical protein [Bacteroidaceae bacterium]